MCQKRALKTVVSVDWAMIHRMQVEQNVAHLLIVLIVKIFKKKQTNVSALVTSYHIYSMW